MSEESKKHALNISRASSIAIGDNAIAVRSDKGVSITAGRDIVMGNHFLARTRRCFVIMPFSGTTEKHTETYWNRFFTDFIKPTVESLGYSCERSIARPSHIIKDILAQLFESDVVLAVLTDYNPNVWYELGVRHTFRNGTIMLIEKGLKAPFDIQEYGVIQYQDDLPARTDFERQLKAFIEAIERSNKTDSPVRDFFDLRPVKWVSVSPDAQHSPLAFMSALSLAQQRLLVVGQNLHSLTGAQFRDAAFTALRQKPIDIQLLLCDWKPDYVRKATREFTHNDFMDDLEDSLKHFAQWQEEADAEKTAGNLRGRLEIRLSKRIGNVSITFVDPQLETGALEVTPVLYESQSPIRARFILTRREHSDMFQGYWSAYDAIFRVRGSRSIRDTRNASK